VDPEQGLEYHRTAVKMPSPDYIIGLQTIDKSTRQFSKAVETNNELFRQMVELLKKTSEAIEELNHIAKLQRPRGKVYPIDLTLPSGSSARLVHIDFVTGNRDSILPTGTNIDYPGAKLYWAQITNDGPGTILYATNESKNSGKGYAKLLANESDPLGIFPLPWLETMNIVLENGSAVEAKVRIRTLA
jgi:hypothetical protein